MTTVTNATNDCDARGVGDNIQLHSDHMVPKIGNYLRNMGEKSSEDDHKTIRKIVDDKNNKDTTFCPSIAFPLSALGEVNSNPFFPLHQYVLLSLVRDLLIVEGMLDPKSNELIHCKKDEDERSIALYMRHWKPDWCKIHGSINLDSKNDKELNEEKRKCHLVDKAHEESLHKKKKTCSSEVRVKVEKEKKTTVFKSTQSLDAKKNSDKPAKAKDRNTDIHYSFKDEAKRIRSKGKKKAKSKFAPIRVGVDSRAKNSNLALPRVIRSSDVASKQSQAHQHNNEPVTIVIEDSDNEDSIGAQELAHVIVNRCFRVSTSSPRINTSPGILIKDELDKRPRSVSVCDADATNTEMDGCSCVKPCTQYLVDEQLLQVSVSHEIHLRDLSQTMLTRCLSTFPTHIFQKLLQKQNIPRSKVFYILSTLVFNASHALYAWQETERELLKHCCFTSQEDLDKEITRLLFNSRDLTRIGGLEPNTSLMSNALLMSSLAQRNMTWSRFAETALGRKQWMERKNAVSYKKYTYHWATQNRCRDNQTKTVRFQDQTQSMSSVVTLTLERAEDQAYWGFRLAREGDMCVVIDVAPDEETNKLRQGDIVMEVCDMKTGNRVMCSPFWMTRDIVLRHAKKTIALGKSRSAFNQPSINHGLTYGASAAGWFQNAVGLFKSSRCVSVKVKRVTSATPLVIKQQCQY